jgi:DNA polymerase III subunit gamma/tau
MLATTEFHKLPETILSRCQHFEFRQISVEKILARLKEIVQAEGVTINETALREIARAGGGSLRDALSSLDQVIAFAGQEIGDADVSAALGLVAFDLLETTINAIAGCMCDKVFEVASELESHGSDLRNFARQLMATLRNLLVLKSGIKDAEILGVAEQEVSRLEALAAKFSEEEVVRSFHLLAEVEKEIKESPFPRFALELGLVKIAGATRLEPLSSAVDRLEALESRLRTDQDQVPARASNPPVTPLSRRENLIEPPASQHFDLEEMSEPVGVIELGEPPAPRSKFSAKVQMVIDELARQNRTPLIIALHDAKAVDVDGSRLVVMFEGESAFTSRLRDSQTLFGEIGQKLFAQPLRIEVRAGQGSIAAPVPPQSKRDRMRELALQNPAVRLAADKLRAEIIDVRETGNDSEG